MEGNPIERLLSVLPTDADMPAARRVRYLVRHTPRRMAIGSITAAQQMVVAVISLADTAEDARLPVALPARMVANRLALASRRQVLAWMRSAISP